jgi:hypothetical protein
MIVKVVDIDDVYKVIDPALFTVGKQKVKRDPTEWLLAMCIAEHSPLREFRITVECHDVPYFAIMHLVRHKIGFEPYVKTSREDITGIPRNKLKQTDLGSFRFTMNLQALLNISKERLCHKAHKVTRELWQMVIEAVNVHIPFIKDICVPKCIYRSFCPEQLLGRGCGYCETNDYIERLVDYNAIATYRLFSKEYTKTATKHLTPEQESL